MAGMRFVMAKSKKEVSTKVRLPDKTGLFVRPIRN